mmetsp:Transcript_54523/g.101984  ORF Transcript_54523/g.101984 Transcript_54523/m.101984 type:complete len:289 (+) Transcript_54523:235-1101(+)
MDGSGGAAAAAPSSLLPAVGAPAEPPSSLPSWLRRTQRKRACATGVFTCSPTTSSCLWSSHPDPSSIRPRSKKTASPGVSPPLSAPFSAVESSSNAVVRETAGTSWSNARPVACAVCCRLAVTNASGLNKPPSQYTGTAAAGPEDPTAGAPTPAALPLRYGLARSRQCATLRPKSASHASHADAHAALHTNALRHAAGVAPRPKSATSARRGLVTLASPAQKEATSRRSESTKESKDEPFATSRLKQRVRAADDDDDDDEEENLPAGVVAETAAASAAASAASARDFS